MTPTAVSKDMEEKSFPEFKSISLVHMSTYVLAQGKQMMSLMSII